ncbi:MAG: MauE/DoxX family redox-associated membrane protein [Solirubrobacteraceae bacterium]
MGAAIAYARTRMGDIAFAVRTQQRFHGYRRYRDAGRGSAIAAAISPAAAAARHAAATLTLMRMAGILAGRSAACNAQPPDGSRSHWYSGARHERRSRHTRREHAVLDLARVVIGGLAVLLGLAGYAKLRRPGPSSVMLRAAGVPAARAATHAVAIAELGVLALALVLPGRYAGIVVAMAFAGLTVGAAVGARRAGDRACGCFGDETGALGRRHVATNLAAALAGLAAAAIAPGSLAALAGRRPGLALVDLLLAVALAAILRQWLRGTGSGGLHGSALRLVDSSARLLEARFSRRSALTRIAVAGSALAVAPVRYLLYPCTALGVVVPGRCRDGLCTDGYTAFCCEINQGLNTCPAGTFVGGWWMCTDYRGHQLCHGAGTRYYIDCNNLPRQPFPGGCRCANDDCSHRRQACNVFRYGQCNTQIKGTTTVVCRVVTCEKPSRIPGLNCNSTLMIDDAVCGHEAGCLEPMATQLPGSGGV